jgi:hypothetical protein
MEKVQPMNRKKMCILSMTFTNTSQCNIGAVSWITSRRYVLHELSRFTFSL